MRIMGAWNAYKKRQYLNKKRDEQIAREERKKAVIEGTAETVAIPDKTVKASSGWTDKFIFPPYSFKMVDGIITNFHQSQSTLYILVCTFCGYDLAKTAYEKAINEKYKFFSYGDAMIVL